MTKVVLVCYLCGEKDLETLQDFSWLVRCRSCGMVFHPELSIDSRAVADHFYDEINMEHRRRISSILLKVARARWRWMQERINLRHGHVLEIGSGTGEFLVAAIKAGWKVDGLELSEKFREAAKTWYHIDLQGDELSRSGHPVETFDAVALLHVFEHLPNPLEFLNQVYAYVKPGGWLFIIVPNLFSWTDSLFGTSSPTLVKPDHFFHYDESTLRRMVERSAFRVAEMVTLEPNHHLWTSMYGFLSSRRKTIAKKSDLAHTGQKGLPVWSIGQMRSKLPYWMGALTSPLSRPWRFWIEKKGMGHEIYLLCRRPL